MSLRTDNAELILTINGTKSAKTLKEMEDSARDLRKALQKIPIDSSDFKVAAKAAAELDAKIKGIKSSLAAAKEENGLFQKAMGGFAKAGAILGTFFAAFSAVGSIVTAARETEKLFAVLKNATGGSEENARALFKELQDFAATTPFALNEVVGAFTKLQQRNFNPTIEQLKTMGDIAASSGKSIDQFVEAILDAQTGEFERLKEFGIVAKKEGDNVQVSFRGQSETFKNTSENMNAYLLKLGELPGISGATAAIAGTLDGSLSNLGDNFNQLLATLGSAGGVFKTVVDAISTALGFVQRLTDRLLTGKRAVGEYSGVIEVVAFVLNAVWKVLQLVGLAIEGQVKLWTFLGQRVGDFIGYVREIPIVGELFETFIITPLRFIADAIDNLPAAWAGFVAATKQAAANIAADLKGLVLNARVFVKNIESALTFSDAGKAKIAAELRDLERQRDIAASSGKSIGEAYIEARDAVLAKSLPPEAAGGGGTTKKTGGGGGGNGGGSAAKKAKEEAEAAAGSLAFLRAEIAKVQKEIENTPGQSRALEPLIIQLKTAEAALKALEDRIAGLKTPTGDIIPTDAEIEALLGGGTARQTPGATDADRLAILDFNAFVLEEGMLTAEELAKFQLSLAQQKSNEELALEAKKQKDKQAEIKEAALSSASSIASATIQIRQNAIQQEAEEAISALDAEYAAKRKAAEGNQQALDRLNKQYEAKKAAIEKEAAEKRRRTALIEATIAAALAVVKALPNPLAAIAAGVAGAAQIAVIASSKFARGGYTGPGRGAVDSTGHHPVGVVHNDEWVAPKWMATHPVWGAQVAALENVRRRGFADGGYTTTPTVSISPLAGSLAATDSSLAAFGILAAEFRSFRADINSWQSSLNVSYLSIEQAGSDLSTVRVDSGI